MSKLLESINAFISPVYVRVRRGNETYSATKQYVESNLRRLVNEYINTKNDEQTLRLIRDDIDNALRRYHEYCIKQNFGAHYKDRDIKDDSKVIFEHMVPASTIRDMLIAETISPEQACNMPTCNLSKEKDDLLREKGWASKTPDIYNFWKRYQYCFDTENKFETHDEVAVDTSVWNLDKHFEFFLKN